MPGQSKHDCTVTLDTHLSVQNYDTGHNDSAQYNALSKQAAAAALLEVGWRKAGPSARFAGFHRVSERGGHLTCQWVET